MGNHLRQSCLWPAALSDPVLLKQVVFIMKTHTDSLLQRKPQLTDAWVTEEVSITGHRVVCVSFVFAGFVCLLRQGLCSARRGSGSACWHAGLELAM